MPSKYDNRRELNYGLKRRIPELFFVQQRSVEEIRLILGYRSTTTIYNALALYRQTGDSVNPYASHGGRPRRLKLADILHLELALRNNPALYLDELQKILQTDRDIQISIPTIFRALQHRGWKHKQLSKPALERKEILRAVFRDRIGEIDPHDIICVDESGWWQSWARRRWGWSTAGERATRAQPFVRGRKLSILPALTLDGGLEARIIVEGAVTAEMFARFIEDDVLPLCTGTRRYILADNAHIHAGAAVREICADAGVEIIFLPPYSPDLMPIEEAFSVLKARCRRYEDAFAYLDEDQAIDLLDELISSVGSEEAHGFFHHCGYI